MHTRIKKVLLAPNKQVNNEILHIKRKKLHGRH